MQIQSRSWCPCYRIFVQWHQNHFFLGLQIEANGGGGELTPDSNGKARTGPGIGADASKFFEIFDKDGSGKVNFEEFSEMIKYMNMDISDHQALKIFSEAADAQGLLDKSAFEKALDVLNTQIASKVLDVMGLSVATLAKIFIVLVVLLLGFFAFIFLGIAAFKTGTTFGTVINSILPCTAALGIGYNSQLDTEDIMRKAEIYVEKVIAMIRRMT